MPHDREAILQKVRQELFTDELLCGLANLPGKRREGKTIRSHLSDEHVRTIVDQGFAHLIGQQGADRCFAAFPQKSSRVPGFGDAGALPSFSGINRSC